MKKKLPVLFSIVLCLCSAVDIYSQPAGAAPADQPQADKRGLRIVGATAEGIKLNRNSTNFSYSFTIEATTDAPVTGLQIMIAPLVGPDGAQVETQCNVNKQACASSPVDIPASGAVQVEVAATLPLEGAYTTAITLTYAGRRESTPLTVTRTRAALPVEVLGIETVRSDSLWPAAPSVWLTLSGKPGVETSQLHLPTIVGLSLTGSENTKYQARFNSITVTGEDGKNVESVVLKSGETHRYLLTINGLNAAGQYAGTLRVEGRDAQPIDKPISILVKSSALVATFLIGIGVWVGYLLRRYGTRDRPRLLQQRRLLILFSETETLEREAGQLNEDEKSVLIIIRRRLDGLYEDVGADLAEDADAAIKLIDDKLTMFPLWVNTRRRANSVRPPELAEPFRVKLNKVREVLREKQPKDDALKEAQDILKTLPDEITKAVKDDLTKRLKEFRDEVEKFRQAVTSASILDSIRDRLEPEIKRAEDSVNSGHLESARAAFDEARLEYARLLTEDLRSNLETATDPLGFDAMKWGALKADVLARLDEVSRETDADKAIAAYQSAYTHYLQALAAALRGEVEKDIKIVQALADKLTDEDKGKYTGALNAIVKRLDMVARHLAAGALREAADEYKQAKDALQATAVELKGKGAKMSGEAAKTLPEAREAGAVPAAAGELPTLAAPERDPLARPSVKDLTKRLRRYDMLVTLVLFIVAVVLGLSLLWVKDPTWGGWEDALTAVLWGLGLHQVAGGAFEGLMGLRDKLSSPSTQRTPVNNP